MLMCPYYHWIFSRVKSDQELNANRPIFLFDFSSSRVESDQESDSNVPVLQIDFHIVRWTGI